MEHAQQRRTERDSESGGTHGNDNFGARYYASSMGRFISPDPSGLAYADPSDPQSLNLYAYVRNNPLILTDSTGLAYTFVCEDDPPHDESNEQENDGGNSVHVFSGSQHCTFWDDGTGYADPPTIPTKPTQNLSLRSYMTLTTQAQACENKIQEAVNNALNTNSTYLGPTAIPPRQMDPRLGPGGRNGAYNFDFFAPGVINPVAGSTGGSGRFPSSGLHIPLPGGKDPTISPWGYNATAGGSQFTAHFDSTNPTDDLVSLLIHFFNDVLLRSNHGC